MTTDKATNKKTRESSLRENKEEFIRDLLSQVLVGEANKRSSIELVREMKNAGHHKKTQTELSLKRDIQRALEKYLSDESTEGLIMSLVGRTNYYYWHNDDDKVKQLARLEMSPERAFALNFIETYLENILPPNIYNNLRADFYVADKVLKKEQGTNNKYLEKLHFNPSGLATFSSIDKQSMTKVEINKWQDIFGYTFNEKTFTADYESIHEDYNTRLTLSPQLLTLFNNQLMLLAYVHKSDKRESAIKFFEVERLSNVEPCSEVHHLLKEPQYIQHHTVKAICHTWVKHYFESVNFGSPIKFTPTQSKDCWMLEVFTQFPLHFDQTGRSDPFFFANYMGMFADAIKIIEPAFLADEMKRRSQSIANLYCSENDEETLSIITSSPKNMRKIKH